ncbi:type III pantothenate kinase [Peptoniphilus indolicus]|uniref:Type III pantothenate kinase n=2 Tax=Peptoniphilus indolicus TaxID=33030 RepID=G4D1W4_9FIRM|nr:type III pantothenate kinase [Peptoniphilus indolicus]EGY80490.1 pantothenate kinase [Peptoniphilus indolicus ATCC 29427]SUB75523.1 Type III pantothenate kinase [Peptoniphilus indolicus]
MLLAINIENKSVQIGLFKDNLLVHKFKIKTDPSETEDEIKLKIKQLMEPYSLNQVTNSIISSVVPDVTKSYREIFPEALVVGAGVKTGLNIKCENPKEVGSDRIIRAAYSLGEKALIINIDEVITIDFLNGNNFMGGMIIPGMNMALNSLKEMAKLSKVELVKVDSIFGNSTTKAIQAGIYHHYLSTVEYVIKNISKEHENLKIVATGEHSKLILEELNFKVQLIQDLALYGLEKIYVLNQKLNLV